MLKNKSVSTTLLKLMSCTLTNLTVIRCERYCAVHSVSALRNSTTGTNANAAHLRTRYVYDPFFIFYKHNIIHS
jgi:hypothetical protein